MVQNYYNKFLHKKGKRKMKKIKTIMIILAILLVSLVSFGGIYVQKQNRMENKVKEYDL